jgi:hypothetical protein
MTSNSAGKGRRKPWTEKQKAFLVGHIERKKRKAERKADRESRERLDAWMLQLHFPEKAKAKRLKGTKNNKEASHWRSQMFVERFVAWPSVLTAKEMKSLIGAYLWGLPKAKSVGLTEEEILLRVGEGSKKKFQGCAKHYPKKEASVRKKLTKLGVYRFNFRLGLWFKCGSPEEALEEAKRLEAEQEALRLAREAREHQEAEARRAIWEAEQEANEAKRLEVEAEKQRQEAYATRPIDWASLSADEVALGLWFAKWKGWLVQGQGLDDLGTEPRRMINRAGVAKWLAYVSNLSASYKADEAKQEALRLEREVRERREAKAKLAAALEGWD